MKELEMIVLRSPFVVLSRIYPICREKVHRSRGNLPYVRVSRNHHHHEAIWSFLCFLTPKFNVKSKLQTLFCEISHFQ
jgi:hypothetical protein